ncbi:hypothetical protein PPACK8108_LOCUS25041 [Phakopsora pachyrhizi]|uniref:Uncharacterized protein n=1 Tax=Phakopsora pachyrhizi TaxID=170000 RepID=A0AAV0BUU8_PHAPC|nr:hypothetical protein PPACK8108_LOCUS25041 [Phakopsora pachyrhizi]
MWARNETDEKVESYSDLVAISQGIFPLPDDVPFHRAGDVDPIIKPNKMIGKEFSNKDKHDLISCLIKQSAAEFVEIHGSNDIDMSKTVKATQMQNLMKFFSETPGALEKLATPSEEFMARDLLTLVSVSDQGKSHYEWTSMLTIMYIAEFLINDKNSKFGEFHKIEIEEYKIVPKLELLRKLTEVNKKVSKLLPRMLKIKTTENSEVWERLKNENLSTWYKEYLQKLQSLEDEIGSDLKRLSVYREVNKYHLPRTEASETNGDLGCWSATGMAELLFGHISVPPVKITDSIKFLETQKGIFKKAKQRDFVSSSIRKKMSKFNQVLQKSKSNIFLSYI